MKRTIQEVMDLLEQKRENAKREIDGIYRKINKNLADATIYSNKLNRLNGEYDAYTDVICLIASSHLLDGGQHEEN